MLELMNYSDKKKKKESSISGENGVVFIIAIFYWP